MGVNKAKLFFKDHVRTLINNEDWETISYLINQRFRGALLKIFKSEELENIFEKLDYQAFLKYTGERKLNELKLLESMGVSKAKDIFKQELNRIFELGTLEDLNIVFRRNYLTLFSDNEIQNLLKNFDFQKILDDNSSIRNLSILHEISKYNKSLVKSYIRNIIEKELSIGNFYTVDSIIKARYLSNYFTKEEQEEIADHFNYEKLTSKQTVFKVLPLLRQLKAVIPLIYKEEIKRIILHEDLNVITFTVNGNYLKDFTKEELSDMFDESDLDKRITDMKILEQLSALGIQKFSSIFDEKRERSNVSLKKEIIDKFENGNYKSLLEMLKKKSYGSGYRNEKVNNLLDSDFEEIFAILDKSEKFIQNFERAIKQKDPPFSVPIKSLAIIAYQDIDSAKKIYKEQASKMFSNASLNIISFLSRSEYSKIFPEDELKEVFSFKNEHIKSNIIDVLKIDDAAPLPLIILKRLTDMGDEDAGSYLKEKLVHLINNSSDSVMKFLNQDGFLNYLKDLEPETQLYIAFSPDLDYSTLLPNIETSKIGDLVDKSIQEQFNKLIVRFQNDKRVWVREDDLDLLKSAILSFGKESFKGLMALYKRDSQNLQVLALECILKLYRIHKNVITNDLKRKLGYFFKEEFKPYYKFLDEIRSVDEYEVILSEYKKEYNELKWMGMK